MRNAVIRKKRLKAERIVDDYMRMPTRIVTPTTNVYLDQQWQEPQPRVFTIPNDRDIELFMHTAWR
jgi:hypothetical protein